ncbi:alpha/beta hydrolase [Dyadobacter tibetensis]|uniref:alpha/beta hydrolase n=1 Tax=Dyadobacter tibetensis TaxID=1211851 RepID=UPI001E3F9A31|nr:alpha/beta hydrolase [Dyadobacter tibetensis]
MISRTIFTSSFRNMTNGTLQINYKARIVTIWAISLLIFLLSAIGTAAWAQKYTPGDSLQVVYKRIDTLDLTLRVYYPQHYKAGKPLATMIFFFGGGWNGGSYKQFEGQAKYFSHRGLITILADYRVFSRNKTSPFEAVADAKSAIRFIRQHQEILGIDGGKIIAAGGSAGGHLAAAADLTALDEPTEDLSISSRPNALVLFNPVFNNGPGQYGYDRIGDRYPEISPFHNIRSGAAPTIIFLGTADKLIPVQTGTEYRDKLKEVGSKAELHLYEGHGHGFFNKGEAYLSTIRQADLFLGSLGYIKGKPKI